MNRYLSLKLDERCRFSDGKAESKIIIDLALNNYLAENNTDVQNDTMDLTFKRLIIIQIKFFILACHNTTSTGAIYTYHLLGRNPVALARVRSEHDFLFGSNLHDAVSLLFNNPHLPNRLPFTIAVIQEALRLYPPHVTAIRTGQPSFLLS
jgi:cytochrome P450